MMIRKFLFPIAAMSFVIGLSNYLLQFPVNDWVTLAAFSFPLCFLVTDITNRLYGAKNARYIIYAGFILGVVLSLWLADVRIAIASGTAFLVSQLLDVAIFDKLRNQAWWKAPVISSFLASITDGVLFYSLAFYGQDLPWIQWAIGDLAVKIIMVAICIIPYRHLVEYLLPRYATS